MSSISLLTTDDKHYLILILASASGKLRTVKVNCPTCGKVAYVKNGYHAVEDSVIVQLGLKILIAQFRCKSCGECWSTNRDVVDELISKEKDFVKSLMLGCVRAGLSLQKASALITETTGVSYSPQYLYELYVEQLSQVKQEKFSSASGVYHYDEQYLLVNGTERCRLTVKDAVTGKVIVDVQTENAQKETIKQVLGIALEGLRVDAFIVDMNRLYPELLKELFPDCKVQWCLFHLYKLIWKELHDEFGKKIPLTQLYNAYTLFQRDPRVQPTNNGLEHYFAATLAKTEKKDFRSAATVVRELNAFRAEWNGHRLFKPVAGGLAGLLKLAGTLFLSIVPVRIKATHSLTIILL